MVAGAAAPKPSLPHQPLGRHGSGRDDILDLFEGEKSRIRMLWRCDKCGLSRRGLFGIGRKHNSVVDLGPSLMFAGRGYGGTAFRPPVRKAAVPTVIPETPDTPDAKR
jgi:hypothetical protein